MNNLLEELKVMPGVVGGYFIHPQKGLLASNLPAMFKPQKLLEISKELVKIHSAGRMNFADISEVFLNYEEMVLIVKQVAPQLYLMVFCDSSVNSNMLAMSINLSLEGMPELVAESQPVKTSPASPTVAQLTPESVMSLPELGKPLQQMSTGLAQVMGPMAEVIFEESLQEWLDLGQSSVDKLPGLLKIIKQEIGDAKKGKEYQSLVVNLLQP